MSILIIMLLLFVAGSILTVFSLMLMVADTDRKWDRIHYRTDLKKGNKKYMKEVVEENN
ncbi:hypothetical protein [Lachnotalea glycerini]|uniref:hypothetical protein n=1 Tax=Lachnotalea glycerini TaxID=1763509 RepID=UPI0015F2657F|nr:hypothetical protein [Lachnotalea glycerini]